LKPYITQAELFEIAETDDLEQLLQWMDETGIKYALKGDEVYTMNMNFQASFCVEPISLILKNQTTPNNVPQVSGVYFLICDNWVVYVGQSAGIGTRINQHLKNKRFDTVSLIEIEGERYRFALESYYIDKLKPMINKDNSISGIQYRYIML